MQRNASLFFAEIPDDIGQLAANPDLGQMLVHEESLAFGIANDDTRHVECIFSTISVTISHNSMLHEETLKLGLAIHLIPDVGSHA